MATYATRLQNVLGPVVERARRWSQSSAAEERPAPPIPALSDEDHNFSAAELAIATPLHSPRALEPVFESFDADPEDGASGQALAIGDPSSRYRPPMSGQSNEFANRTPESPPPSSTWRSPISFSDLPTASSPTSEDNSTSQNPAKSALPEDDGQKFLRQKLVEISRLNISERERAVRMHSLMLEKYNASRRPGEMFELESAQSGQFQANAEEPYISQHDNPFKLSPLDIAKTYYTGPPTPDVAANGELVVQEEITTSTDFGAPQDIPQELGCPHYRRGVKLQCSTCEKWHTCRFCHDEKEDHVLIRKETKNMLCMHCGTAQPVGQDCKNCGIRSARYYCDKCKLWDNDPRKSIYHCNDCGICRIGEGLGKDFFHCKKCGVCMSISLEGSHRCIERSTECDCPICGEYMFTSTMTVVFMRCGHSIHRKCYYEHMKTSYRCPTCTRTIVNMESQFRALDCEIDAQPLPAPYDKWRSLITCNDCSAKQNVPFHFLGLKCDNCKSYNTSQIRTIRPENMAGDVDRDNNNTSPAVPPAPLRTISSNSLATAQPLNSPPRLARAEAGPTDGEAAILNANRALAAAEEAIGVTLDMGDEDLIVDDGWETNSDAVSDLEVDDEDEFKTENGDEEDDEDEDDPIQLIGHP
ncbi:uncharacterized protein LAJ45_05202 [Morchella importuna]|uniref:uncharacterized protein n=1 Tax=Morchella importuna TaxID=1174673 RepID=UPI001E8CABC6|nr:uncharacterized protein LAJ45_05202 [Morchella importuna]KAH8150507.1 hypothetical protein LAJ45_05202 [Morchella importuna]